MNTDTKSFTEQEWAERKQKIRREIMWVDIKPYSHNLIGAYMSDLNDDDMKRMCSECELGRVGWTHLDDGTALISEADKAINKCIFNRREKLLDFTKEKNDCDEETDEDEDEDEDEEADEEADEEEEADKNE
jgi:hypothetical protein